MISYQRGSELCLVVGSGLLGTAIGHALSVAGWSIHSRRRIGWSNPSHIQREIHEISEAAHIAHFVWAAGASGFSSTPAQTRPEMLAFECFVQAISSCNPSSTLHMLSSAGGIHEGQRRVERGDPPAPLRPYGHLKLEQEIAARKEIEQCAIYRVSSAYGLRLPGMRRGLISTLYENSMRNQITMIVGQPHTQRDFVFAADIGSAVERGIAAKFTSDEPHYLISGRPTQIIEVLAIMHRVTGRPSAIRYAKPENSATVTFGRSLMSHLYAATPLDIGVHAMASASRFVH